MNKCLKGSEQKALTENCQMLGRCQHWKQLTIVCKCVRTRALGTNIAGFKSWPHLPET